MMGEIMEIDELMELVDCQFEDKKLLNNITVTYAYFTVGGVEFKAFINCSHIGLVKIIGGAWRLGYNGYDDQGYSYLDDLDVHKKNKYTYGQEDTAIWWEKDGVKFSGTVFQGLIHSIEIDSGITTLIKKLLETEKAVVKEAKTGVEIRRNGQTMTIPFGQLQSVKIALGQIDMDRNYRRQNDN